MGKYYEIGGYGRDIAPVAIGSGTPKLITIVGMTGPDQTAAMEAQKTRTAYKYGASIIADVSTEGHIADFHRTIMDAVPMPLSTVPFYEIRQRAIQRDLWPGGISKGFVLDVIAEQAERGVGCMTLHATLTKDLSRQVLQRDRTIKLQARGGGFIYEYIQKTDKENPLWEYLDDILPLMSKYGVAMSLGSSFRSGTVSDNYDALCLQEQLLHSQLCARAETMGVNPMVEIGSHHRYNLIGPYVKCMKRFFNGAPLRLLGPLGTEKGLGYDHITAAICAVPAIEAGLDIITCVTRSEHIGLPDENDIRESLVAIRIAIELSLQEDTPSEKDDISFQCGLGFGSFKPQDVIDLDRALELKRLKNNGSLEGCSMCNDSCRMVLDKERS